MSSFWQEFRERWHILALVGAVCFAAGGWADGLWAAPQQAQDALVMARQNSRSIDRLHRTIRIYICSREELDRMTRIRLDCREFGP